MSNSYNQDNNFNLPTLSDFQEGGRFYKIKKLNIKSPLPLSLLLYIFPDYNIFEKNNQVPKKYLNNVKKLCIQLNKEALQEERNRRKRDLQEQEFKRIEKLVIRNMEHQIRDHFDTYYKNLYNNRLCKKCMCDKVNK
jgi:excinuclease UvrABC ATPase subunit